MIGKEFRTKIEEATDSETTEESIDFDDENIDDFFDKVGLELNDNEKTRELAKELEGVFSDWLSSQAEKVKERIKNFGLSEQDGENLIKQIGNYLSEDIRAAMHGFDQFKTELRKIQDKLKDSPEIEASVEFVANMTKSQLLDLLIRKLKGEITEEEKYILMLLDVIKHRGQGGSYNLAFDDINFSLFNNKDLKVYSKYLSHELTHYGLNHAVEEAVQMRARGALDLKSNPGQTSVPFAFSGMLTAIDESAAHLAEGRTPDYNSYAEKVHPRIFQQFFEAMKEAIKNLDEKQKDQFFIEIYREAVGSWQEDMDWAGFSKIAVEFIQKIKNKNKK